MSEELNVFRWSFSAWERYDGCAFNYKLRYIERLPSSPPGPAAARGLDLHDRVEKYITEQNRNPNIMQYGDPTKRFGDKKAARIHDKYIPIIEGYKEHPNGDRHCEKQMAFDSQWYLTGFTTKYSACKAVLDAVKFTIHDDGLKELDIGEWKSGSPKERHADQRKLYALFGLKGWLADKVNVTTYYLEHDIKPVRLSVTPDNWDKLVALWEARRGQMQSDKIFAPKPGDHCNWCDYAARKGGPCKFGR